MTTTPQALANSLSENPTPGEFIAMGQTLVGKQPSLLDLVDRCADSMQAEMRANFEAGFIAEKKRLMGDKSDATEQAIRMLHLKRSTYDYDSPEAHMAWWAWQTASSTSW